MPRLTAADARDAVGQFRTALDHPQKADARSATQLDATPSIADSAPEALAAATHPEKRGALERALAALEAPAKP